MHALFIALPLIGDDFSFAFPSLHPVPTFLCRWIPLSKLDDTAVNSTKIDLQDAVDSHYLMPCQCYHVLVCVYQFSPKYSVITAFRSPIQTIMSPRQSKLKFPDCKAKLALLDYQEMARQCLGAYTAIVISKIVRYFKQFLGAHRCVMTIAFN